jgi:predicted nucleic-acid-binding protein
MTGKPEASGFGLDTSVVLRLLVGDPQEQAQSAFRFINEAATQGHEVWVSDLVVAETYFALHAHYHVPKEQALRALLELLESGRVNPEPGGCSRQAIRDTLSSSRKLGFLDHLIHTQYAKNRAKLVSFENASERLPNAVRLKG